MHFTMSLTGISGVDVICGHKSQFLETWMLFGQEILQIEVCV